jgi:hypothetical protein
MSNIFILGENSFIAKHLYIKIKKNKHFNVILLNHLNYFEISESKNTDIIINFCGVNRSSCSQDYEEANHIFLQKVLQSLKSKPFFIHISSLMIYGFKGKNNLELSSYQKWFIQSKINGENYLLNNYDNNMLCIIRPSNIYGYDCKPYYNNLLSSLVFEKLNSLTKINNINSNCQRNMLSVNNLIDKVYDILFNKTNGIYNIMSNNNIKLDILLGHIYNNNIPSHINILNGDIDILNMENNDIVGSNIIVSENLLEEIQKLEIEMNLFNHLKNNIFIKQLEILKQSRGNMVEITNLHSKRLYKITLTQNSVRGNHFHYQQIEEFYTNRDKVIYLFSDSTNKEIIYFHISIENELIIVNPNIIHTLSNDFMNNYPEIIISSTQEFISDYIPDTNYINII